MKLELSNRKLRLTGLASLSILTSVILKNGAEQLGMSKHFMSAVVGRILFMGGWLLLAYSFVGKPTMSMKSRMSYGGAIAVIIAVFLMKGGAPKIIAAPLFVGGWLATIIAVGMGKPMLSKQLGIFALANVLGSMMIVLPWQRANGVVDGIGMPMFTMTWVSLILANSL